MLHTLHSPQAPGYRCTPFCSCATHAPDALCACLLACLLACVPAVLGCPTAEAHAAPGPQLRVCQLCGSAPPGQDQHGQTRVRDSTHAWVGHVHGSVAAHMRGLAICMGAWQHTCAGWPCAWERGSHAWVGHLHGRAQAGASQGAWPNCLHIAWAHSICPRRPSHAMCSACSQLSHCSFPTVAQAPQPQDLLSRCQVA